MRYIGIKKLICAVSVLSLLMFSGCTTFDSFKTEFITGKENNEKVVKIGVFEPLTGDSKDKAADEIKGIELAHSLYPTVDGKKVELIYADNRSDIYAAETVIQDLITKEPVAILGSYGNAESLAASEYIDKAKIPTMAITNTNPLVTSTSDYYFRACFVDTYQGTALAQYAYSGLKAKKAATLVPAGDEQATAIAQKFMTKFKKLTKNSDAIVINEEFKPGDTDFTNQLNKIKNSNVKTVFLPAATDDAINIIRQAYDLHLDVKFLGTDSWDGNILINELGKFAASKAVFTKASEIETADTKDDELEKFMEAYKGKYGKDASPDNAVALGYDAYRIVINAIGEAGSDGSGERLRAQILQTTNYKGASGKISFNSAGDPSKSMTIYNVSISKGKYEASYIVEANGKGKRIK